MSISKIIKHIKSCKNHIEMILNIFKVFLKWSQNGPPPPPHPWLGKAKLPRVQKSQKNRKINTCFMIFQDYTTRV